jgi:hypothetical protein
VNTARSEAHLTDSEREGLAQFHKTISEQLNARLAESPRFFGVLVITGTAYGYVLWKFQEVGMRLFVLASVVAYMAVFWSLWYLAALGYAFRYLQNSQHRIEDDLGWDSYRNETTGIPPKPSCRLSYVFWLLPGIYHAHAFGLAILLLIVTAGFFAHWPGNRCVAAVLGLVTGLATIGLVLGVNTHYVRKFSRNRIPARKEELQRS